MAIDAKSKTVTITTSPDGKKYGKYSSGKYVAPTLTVAGWGQTSNCGAEGGTTITGPVPLAIFCHAIGTESSNSSLDVFRENGYHFDFGYGNVYSAGTWTYSGKPKGNQIGGPVAAHVYETPGTYVLSLTTQDPTGNSYTVKTTISAIDADGYWSTEQGRSTVLLPNATTSVWPTWANNTRYLLESGQDYTRLGSINITNKQNVSVQAYGSGAAPIVNDCFADKSQTSTPTITARIIFSGLDANSNTSLASWIPGWEAQAYASRDIPNTGELSSPVSASDVLFYKCKALYAYGGTRTYSSWASAQTKTFNKPRRTFYYECDFNSRREELWFTGLPFFQQMYEFAFMGNSVDKPGEHSIRVQGATYGFVAHNYLHGQTGDDASGNIKTLGTITGGSGYVNGTYNHVPLTGGRGYGNAANITISSGSVSAINIANSSSYYLYNNVSASSASLGRSGSGFSVQITSLNYATPNPKHALTIRGGAGVENAYSAIFSSESGQSATRYVVAADNILANTNDNGNVSWVAYIGPQNSTSAESLEYVILERNEYANIASPDYNIAYTVSRGARQITVRNENYKSLDDTNLTGLSSSLDFGVVPTEWANGPWYSDKWTPGTTIDGTYKKSTPTGILPTIKTTKTSNIDASFTATGWGQTAKPGQVITGPAPLVIFFDATDTRSANANTNVFREFGYHFDFGYDSANAAIIGNWEYSGKPKANQIGGPLATHMYEIPGTYTASVRAQSPTGEYQDRYITIVVQNANTIYSGANTVLVSTDNSSDAAYPSAVTYNVAASGAVTFASDKRYLFKRGQDFTSVTHNILQNVARIQISTFGSGVKPLIEFGDIGKLPPKTYETQLNSLTIKDANVNLISIGFANDLHVIGMERNISGTAGETAFGYGTTVTYYFKNVPANTNRKDIKFPKNIGNINANYKAFDSLAVSYCSFGLARMLTFMGNQTGNNGSHNYRIAFTNKCFVGHNKIFGANASYSVPYTSGDNNNSCIKLHSPGGLTTTFADDLTLVPKFLDRGTKSVSAFVPMYLNFFDHSQEINPTVFGNSLVTSSQYKFANYGKSGYFDGNGDYLSYPNDAAYNLSSGEDFTTECWFYCTALTTGSQKLFGKDGVSGNSCSYQLAISSSGNLQYTIGDGTSSVGDTYTGPTTITLNQWNHAALVRNGSNAYMYLNGTLEKTNAISTMVNGVGAFIVGYQTDQAANSYFNGYMQDLIVISDAARYTTNFAPSTLPFYFSGGMRSQQVVIADNYFPISNTPYIMSVSPQNAQSNEWLEDIIVERNIYESDSGTPYRSGYALGTTGVNVIARDLIIGARPNNRTGGSNCTIGFHGAFVGLDQPDPSSRKGPYYFPAGEIDIGAANNTYVAVSGIIPNKAGT